MRLGAPTCPVGDLKSSDAGPVEASSNLSDTTCQFAELLFLALFVMLE
jgi:hypothetical protein